MRTNRSGPQKCEDLFQDLREGPRTSRARIAAIYFDSPTKEKSQLTMVPLLNGRLIAGMTVTQLLPSLTTAKKAHVRQYHSEFLRRTVGQEGTREKYDFAISTFPTFKFVELHLVLRLQASR